MKKTAREKIILILASNPEATPSDITRETGVSRQRVHQIMDKLGIPRPKQIRFGSPEYIPRQPKPRVITGGVAVTITHHASGTIGELLVAADLTARGYNVFFPLVRTTSCDLISLHKDKVTIERIEVRCARRDGDNQVRYSRPDISKSDRRAIVVTGEPIIYDPPFE